MRAVQAGGHRDDALRLEMLGLIEQRHVAQRAHRIARGYRRRHAVLHPQRRPGVAQLVAVFDVVVDEREIVQQLDGGGRGERVLTVGAFGFGGGDQNARAQSFPAFGPRIVKGEMVAHHRADR